MFHFVAKVVINIFVNQLLAISLNISILSFLDVEYWEKEYFEDSRYMLLICVPERNVFVDAPVKLCMR